MALAKPRLHRRRRSVARWRTRPTSRATPPPSGGRRQIVRTETKHRRCTPPFKYHDTSLHPYAPLDRGADGEPRSLDTAAPTESPFLSTTRKGQGERAAYRAFAIHTPKPPGSMPHVKFNVLISAPPRLSLTAPNQYVPGMSFVKNYYSCCSFCSEEHELFQFPLPLSISCHSTREQPSETSHASVLCHARTCSRPRTHLFASHRTAPLAVWSFDFPKSSPVMSLYGPTLDCMQFKTDFANFDQVGVVITSPPATNYVYCARVCACNHDHIFFPGMHPACANQYHAH